MAVSSLWQSVENWPLSQFIASSEWAFPTFESIHVIAIAVVVGTVVIMDLRLMGVASKGARVTEISRDTLRWTWLAFAVATVFGGLLFISKASTYMVNPYFVWKFVMIALAGINMAVFHVVTWKNVAKWDLAGTIPTGARLAGGVSLGLWIVVVFLARAIGFTLDKFS